MKKDLLTIRDLSTEDCKNLFQRAAALKAISRKGIREKLLNGKTVGLIFDKPSTRTRIAFEVAVLQLGGTPIFIHSKDTQISRNEPVRDTARVLSRYLDGLVIRTFSQEFLEEFASCASIPVINALTDDYHPTQVLSDLLTVIEHKGGYEGLKIAWVGDGNNVSHSWINAAVTLDLNLVLACPEDFCPDKAVLQWAVAAGTGKIEVVTDPVRAVHQADVVYTDVWTSMGQESEYSARKDAFKAYQVNRELMQHARKDAIVMHCLPAHRGEEISEDLMDDPDSVIWDQAENKLHIGKAIIEWLIGQGESNNV